MWYFYDFAAESSWKRSQEGVWRDSRDRDERYLRRARIDYSTEEGLLEAIEHRTIREQRLSSLEYLTKSGLATPRCLPLMMRIAGDSSELAGLASGLAAHIGGRDALPFFRSLLRNPAIKHKWTYLDAIAEWGDESDADLVCEIFIQGHQKRRAVPIGGMVTPALTSLELLAGFPDQPATRRAFEWARGNCSKLDDDERRYTPVAVPEVGVGRTGGAIAIAGYASLSLSRHHGSVCGEGAERGFGVIPIDLSRGNARRQLARAERLCGGMVVMEPAMLDLPLLANSPLRQRPVLTLEPPGPLGDWGAWLAKGGGLTGREERNLNRTVQFIEELPAWM